MTEKITVEYVPPPPPEPGKIVVRAPKDKRGYPVFPNLHLSHDLALELWSALGDILFPTGEIDAEPRTQVNTADA